MALMKYDADIVKKIAGEVGVSVSSVYKIMKNPMGFSPETVKKVRLAAIKYSKTDVGAAGNKEEAKKVYRIGVIIPNKPMYFWKEAVEGFKKSKNMWQNLLKCEINLIYRYYTTPVNGYELDRLYKELLGERLDGCILFPVKKTECKRFIRNLDGIPLIIFNDLQVDISEFSNAAYIGADNYDEGNKAGMIVAEQPRRMNQIIILVTEDSMNSESIRRRINGFKNKIREVNPESELDEVFLPLEGKTTASAFAEKIFKFYEKADVDCIYVSSGITHVACDAVCKISKKLGRMPSTIVVGHEVSPSDKKYILSGLQIGYIKQNMYLQSTAALDEIMTCLISHRNPEPCLYKSSVFIR